MGSFPRGDNAAQALMGITCRHPFVLVPVRSRTWMQYQREIEGGVRLKGCSYVPERAIVRVSNRHMPQVHVITQVAIHEDRRRKLDWSQKSFLDSAEYGDERCYNQG